jgi:hypothetical protein
MTFLRHIQCYHSHADPIWWDGTFKSVRILMTVVCDRCARLLSADVRAGKVKSSDICEATISQRLAANRGMSDPSLLLRIGLAQR